MVKALQKTMDKFNTDYVLSNAIADSVTYWLDSGQVPQGKFPQAMWEALEAQENIGWMHLFGGNCRENGSCFTTPELLPTNVEYSMKAIFGEQPL